MAISLPRSAEAAAPSALTASSMTVRSMSGMDLGTPGCAIERSSKSPEMVEMVHQYTSTYYSPIHLMVYRLMVQSAYWLKAGPVPNGGLLRKVG